MNPLIPRRAKTAAVPTSVTVARWLFRLLTRLGRTHRRLRLADPTYQACLNTLRHAIRRRRAREIVGAAVTVVFHLLAAIDRT